MRLSAAGGLQASVSASSSWTSLRSTIGAVVVQSPQGSTRWVPTSDWSVSAAVVRVGSNDVVLLAGTAATARVTLV